MQDMYRITYISKSEVAGDKESVKAQIESILSSATKNNPELGITGALLYSGGYFCQVIEGEEDNIEELYETIQMDPRHSDVTILNYEACEGRIFTEWAMAFAGIQESLKFDLDGIKENPSELKLKETGNSILDTLESLVIKKQS
ncbi:BLUF domain-containing protein [Glaciecola sp. MH2013]|uniref:BLUF domain-containing protein n=1 Tax=Glaciecola sp. MH2013 TaxID=2785524 RepID=UPI00189D3139|nr:BLUF domain-containing protein [Glaciecola sp. MH2013]MBF7073283.1 BLUF domain-containing protein [Glaciecola sp. MH2013]